MILLLDSANGHLCFQTLGYTHTQVNFPFRTPVHTKILLEDFLLYHYAMLFRKNNRNKRQRILNLKVGYMNLKWQSTPHIPAWKIPWTEEPGRLQSMGSQRVGHG